MRQSCLRISLLLASSLLVQTAWAQRKAVEPLTPVQAVMKPVGVAKALGQLVPTKAPQAASQLTSASPAPSQARVVIPQPLYLVNSQIIIGNDLAKINPRDITNLEVYKGEGAALGWRAAAPGSTINLTLKPGIKIRSVSLAQLQRRQHLAGPVRFEVDGRPLAGTSLRIAPAAIEALEVRPATAEAAYSILNIKLQPLKPQPSNGSPGTIRIRGVASR